MYSFLFFLIYVGCTLLFIIISKRNLRYKFWEEIALIGVCAYIRNSCLTKHFTLSYPYKKNIRKSFYNLG